MKSLKFIIFMSTKTQNHHIIVKNTKDNESNYHLLMIKLKIGDKY